jgi:hypothetical protein
MTVFSGNRSQKYLTGLQDKKMMIKKIGTGCFATTCIQLMAGFGVLRFKKGQKHKNKDFMIIVLFC